MIFYFVQFKNESRREPPETSQTPGFLETKEKKCEPNLSPGSEDSTRDSNLISGTCSGFQPDFRTFQSSTPPPAYLEERRIKFQDFSSDSPLSFSQSHLFSVPSNLCSSTAQTLPSFSHPVASLSQSFSINSQPSLPSHLFSSSLQDHKEGASRFPHHGLDKKDEFKPVLCSTLPNLPPSLYRSDPGKIL